MTKCSMCNGTGRVKFVDYDSADQPVSWWSEPCPKCDGRGNIDVNSRSD